jgi:hypothetical protein
MIMQVDFGGILAHDRRPGVSLPEVRLRDQSHPDIHGSPSGTHLRLRDSDEETLPETGLAKIGV